MIKLFEDDAYKVIRLLKDTYFDSICTDPPYNIDYTDWDKAEIKYEVLAEEFQRLLKPNGSIILFCGWSNADKVKQVFEQAGYILMNWIIWDRIKGRGGKYNFTSTREDILWFVKDENDYTFNKIPSNIIKKTKGMGLKNGCKYRSLSNVWTDISPIVPWSKEYNGYECQKPLALMKRIIKIFTNENDIVLDCFAGSGTTGGACENLNRNCFLVENNPKGINIIKKRVVLNSE